MMDDLLFRGRRVEDAYVGDPEAVLAYLDAKFGGQCVRAIQRIYPKAMPQRQLNAAVIVLTQVALL